MYRHIRFPYKVQDDMEMPRYSIYGVRVADSDLTCTFECLTVLLSFVSYESHGKATSDNGE